MHGYSLSASNMEIMWMRKWALSPSLSLQRPFLLLSRVNLLTKPCEVTLNLTLDSYEKTHNEFAFYVKLT